MPACVGLLRCLALVSAALASAQDEVRREGDARALRAGVAARLAEPAARGAEARRLLAAGSAAVPDLIALLHDKRAEVQMAALGVLSALGPLAAAAEPELQRMVLRGNPSLAPAAALVQMHVRAPARWVVTQFGGDRILLLDATGQEVGAIEKVPNPWSAKPLANGNYLVSDAARVREICSDGTQVWSVPQPSPLEARPLLNGNILVACWQTGDGVREIDRQGRTVWEFRDIDVSDAERLVDGNTLTADRSTGRILEIAPDKRVVWQIGVGGPVGDVDRLPNGNTLAVFDRSNVVREYATDGRMVWELALGEAPEDAERLPNGHTVVALMGAVREYDAKGQVVWEAKMPAVQVGDVTRQ